MLWHIMKLYAHYGYKDFVLALGYKGEMIRRYFFENRDTDFNVTCVDTGQESSTGERIVRVREHLPEEEFMVTYGDGVADLDISKLVQFHRTQGTLGTITGVNPRSRYGLINIDGDTNRVTGFFQKPTLHDHINGGFMIFKREALNHFDNGPIENVFNILIPRRELSVYRHGGFWKCMDTYQEVEELEQWGRQKKPGAVWTKKTTGPQKFFGRQTCPWFFLSPQLLKFLH